ncbi:hypothetical protein ig2599ANME_0618 [groundwater metagenome]
MRTCHLWRKVANIVLFYLGKYRISIALPLTVQFKIRYPLPEIFFCGAVSLYDTCFPAHLNSHVAHGHPAGYVHLSYRGTAEFRGLIPCPFNSHIANKVKDNILRVHAPRELSVDLEPHALWHSEPQLSCGEHERHVSAACAC